MTIKELLEWNKLKNSDNLLNGEYSELIRLNHLVMEQAHEIHNNNMLGEEVKEK